MEVLTLSLAEVGKRHVVTTADFAGFYTSNWSDVAGYCSALAGSAVVGEELAQEAFARLYARWSLVQEPRPYVFRIASNLAKSTARKASREQPTEHLPEQVAESMGVDPSLYDAVLRLPERLRSVVLLHYYADLPIESVATTLRRPVGSVKRQLNEARGLLAAALGDRNE